MILTPQAKAYAKAMFLSRGREEIIQELEACGIACYDEEETEELADAAVESVESGDIEFDWTIVGAGKRLYLLWLDIEEIWTDRLTDTLPVTV